MASADPNAFNLWKPEDLASVVPGEKLADGSSYYTQLAHRETSGEAELHERWTDIFVIQSGEGALLIGGSVEGRREIAPGEIRGAAVVNGDRHAIGAGDIVHVRANTPHQMLRSPTGGTSPTS